MSALSLTAEERVVLQTEAALDALSLLLQQQSLDVPHERILSLRESCADMASRLENLAPHNPNSDARPAAALAPRRRGGRPPRRERRGGGGGGGGGGVSIMFGDQPQDGPVRRGGRPPRGGAHPSSSDGGGMSLADERAASPPTASDSEPGPVISLHDAAAPRRRGGRPPRGGNARQLSTFSAEAMPESAVPAGQYELDGAKASQRHSSGHARATQLRLPSQRQPAAQPPSDADASHADAECE